MSTSKAGGSYGEMSSSVKEAAAMSRSSSGGELQERRWSSSGGELQECGWSSSGRWSSGRAAVSCRWGSR